MTPETLRNVLEAAMLAGGRALSLDDFMALFEGSAQAPDRDTLREALTALGESLGERPVELVEVASGYRLQVRQQYSGWLGGLFSERPPRYSRALLETLALIAYRQPVTRGEIEEVRGVAVSSNIIKTLMEREWIRVLGHREVPGRPALYGTTREFLDHFGLRGLDGLPALAEIRDLDRLEPDLFASLPPADAVEVESPHGMPDGADAAVEIAGDGEAHGDRAGAPARDGAGAPARDGAGAPARDDAGTASPERTDAHPDEPESAHPREPESAPARDDADGTATHKA